MHVPVAVADQPAGQLFSGLHELVAGRHHPDPGARDDRRLGHAHGGQETDLPENRGISAGQARVGVSAAREATATGAGYRRYRGIKSTFLPTYFWATGTLNPLYYCCTAKKSYTNSN